MFEFNSGMCNAILDIQKNSVASVRQFNSGSERA
jgi:hypothetical protein